MHAVCDTFRLSFSISQGLPPYNYALYLLSIFLEIKNTILGGRFCLVATTYLRRAVPLPDSKQDKFNLLA